MVKVAIHLCRVTRDIRHCIPKAKFVDQSLMTGSRKFNFHAAPGTALQCKEIPRKTIAFWAMELPTRFLSSDLCISLSDLL